MKNKSQLIIKPQQQTLYKNEKNSFACPFSLHFMCE